MRKSQEGSKGMCTSLLYTDAAGKAYFGRTLELTSDLPYQLVFFPAGLPFSSHLEGHAPLAYQSKFSVLAVTMPGRMPTAAEPLGYGDLKVLEGMNDQGLTFSLLSYPAARGRSDQAGGDAGGALGLGSGQLGARPIRHRRRGQDGAGHAAGAAGGA